MSWRGIPKLCLRSVPVGKCSGSFSTPPTPPHRAVSPPKESGASRQAKTGVEAETRNARAGRKANPASPPAYAAPPSPGPSRKVAGLGCPPPPSPARIRPHPLMFPWWCSPRAGAPLGSRWLAGEPPESTSVTAEAGKLPILNVRPFWPFQVVESGLWGEALVQGLGARGEELSSSVPRSGLCPEEGSLFLSNTKGLCGPIVAPAGRPGLGWSSRSPVGQGGDEAEDRGSSCWREAEMGPGSGGCPPPGAGWEARGPHLPSMIVMGSPGSILRAPGSVTSLTQRPSGGQACRDRRKGWLGLWRESEGSCHASREEHPPTTQTHSTCVLYPRPRAGPSLSPTCHPVEEADPDSMSSWTQPRGQGATKGGPGLHLWGPGGGCCDCVCSTPRPLRSASPAPLEVFHFLPAPLPPSLSRPLHLTSASQPLWPTWSFHRQHHPSNPLLHQARVAQHVEVA